MVARSHPFQIPFKNRRLSPHHNEKVRVPSIKTQVLLSHVRGLDSMCIRIMSLLPRSRRRRRAFSDRFLLLLPIADSALSLIENLDRLMHKCFSPWSASLMSTGPLAHSRTLLVQFPSHDTHSSGLLQPSGYLKVKSPSPDTR